MSPSVVMKMLFKSKYSIFIVMKMLYFALDICLHLEIVLSV